MYCEFIESKGFANDAIKVIGVKRKENKSMYHRWLINAIKLKAFTGARNEELVKYVSELDSN